VPITPVWLCPVTPRRIAPLFPLAPGRTYVNVGFWGTVPAGSEANRAVEREVAELGGLKTLYSEVYYDRETFDRYYGGEAYRAVKARYDPDHRLTGLYEKVVERR
jgi:FAD/FMN-containing dehydrogenase